MVTLVRICCFFFRAWLVPGGHFPQMLANANWWQFSPNVSDGHYCRCFLVSQIFHLGEGCGVCPRLRIGESE